MSWLKRAGKFTGYKIVAFNGKEAYSIYDPRIKIDLTIGSISGQTYLGTTRQFCLDYYTGLTNDQDLLLTYEYGSDDIISGSPDGNGEIVVKKAILKNIEGNVHENEEII